jgi:hypothetical protein
MPFPDICVEDRESCPNEWPTLKYAQNACSLQEVQLRDAHGEHYDLTGRKVTLIAKEGIDAQLIRIAKEATIKDAQQGVVEIQLDQTDTTMPGLFVGEFVIEELPQEESSAESSEGESSEDSSDTEYTYSVSDPCYIVAKLRCYVEIQEDLWHTNNQYHTLSIAEVRLAIRDKCREDNFLLDRVQFTDTEIAWALRRPIDYWNEALPPLGTNYTTMNFPFIYNWLTGVVGELLFMAAENTERNRLRYSAAGLNIDDKDQAAFYMAASDKYRAEYKAWVRERKRAINVGQAFGSTSLRSFANYSGGQR